MRLLFGLLLTAAVFCSVPYAFAVEYEDYDAVLKSLMNPHEQIDDEGYILWGKCVICHPVLPDVERARSIADVKLRFEENPMVLCYSCHRQPRHPGGAWMGRAMSDGKITGAPNHLIEPPQRYKDNINLSLKEVKIMLPFDPKTNKIFCATCHNPHERGLLKGRANAGADIRSRLRTTGATICQYCHRK